MVNKPPYKDSRGRWRTQSLFTEFYSPQKRKEKYPPIFTLKEYDETDDEGNVIPSMRQMFLSYDDPTGYQFAKAVLRSYEHWKRLTSQKWFMSHLDGWLEELEIKLKSEGLKKVKDVAVGESAQAFQASKFLISKGWEVSKGRPKKAEIERQARIQAGDEAEVEEDLERIRLVK